MFFNLFLFLFVFYSIEKRFTFETSVLINKISIKNKGRQKKIYLSMNTTFLNRNEFLGYCQRSVKKFGNATPTLHNK